MSDPSKIVTTPQKPTAKLEQWFTIAGHYYGKVYDHPLVKNGKEIKTSVVIEDIRYNRNNHIIETKSSFFVLGTKRQPTKEERQIKG